MPGGYPGLRFLDDWILREIAEVVPLGTTQIWSFSICQDEAEAHGFTDQSKCTSKSSSRSYLKGRILTKTSAHRKSFP